MNKHRFGDPWSDDEAFAVMLIAEKHKVWERGWYGFGLTGAGAGSQPMDKAVAALRALGSQRSEKAISRWYSRHRNDPYFLEAVRNIANYTFPINKTGDRIAQFNGPSRVFTPTKKTPAPTPVATTTAEPLQKELPLLEVDAFDLIDTIQSKYPNPMVETQDEAGEAVRKIVSVSDIHFPFARIDLLEETLSLHVDADVLVLNGDILEGYAASSFSKSREVTIVDEYRCAFALIKWCSENYEKVILTEGNHESRVARVLSENGVNKNTVSYFNPSALGRIANGEEINAAGKLVKKHDFDNVHFDPRDSWYCKVGKAIFAHPHARGAGGIASLAHKTANYFSSRYPEEEIDTVVIGHTHKISKFVYDRLLIMEQGCFAGPMHYAHTPHLTYSGGSQNGYAVLYQDAEGNTLRNLSNVYALGSSNPPKKAF